MRQQLLRAEIAVTTVAGNNCCAVDVLDNGGVSLPRAMAVAMLVVLISIALAPFTSYGTDAILRPLAICSCFLAYPCVVAFSLEQSPLSVLRSFVSNALSRKRPFVFNDAGSFATLDKVRFVLFIFVSYVLSFSLYVVLVAAALVSIQSATVLCSPFSAVCKVARIAFASVVRPAWTDVAQCKFIRPFASMTTGADLRGLFGFGEESKLLTSQGVFSCNESAVWLGPSSVQALAGPSCYFTTTTRRMSLLST